MKVRCKFRCDKVTKTKHWSPDKGYLYGVEMSPVSGGSEENKSFWEATPGGKVEFYSINEPKFEPGKEYYIDISEA